MVVTKGAFDAQIKPLRLKRDQFKGTILTTSSIASELNELQLAEMSSHTRYTAFLTRCSHLKEVHQSYLGAQNEILEYCCINNRMEVFSTDMENAK